MTKYIDGTYGYFVADDAAKYAGNIEGAMFVQIDENVVTYDDSLNERSIETTGVFVRHTVRDMKPVAVLSWIYWNGDEQGGGGFNWVPIEDNVRLHEQFYEEVTGWKGGVAKIRYLELEVPDFGDTEAGKQKVTDWLDDDIDKIESLLPAMDVALLYPDVHGRRVVLQHLIDLRKAGAALHPDEAREIRSWLHDFGPEEEFGLSETLVDTFPELAQEVLDDVMGADAATKAVDREVHRATMQRYMHNVHQEIAGLLHYWTENHLPGDFLSGPEFPFDQALEEVESRVGQAAYVLGQPLVVSDPIMRIYDGMTGDEIDKAVSEAEAIDGLGRWHYAGQRPGAACGAGEDKLTTADTELVSCTACKRLLAEDEDAPYDGSLGKFTALIDAIGLDDPVGGFDTGEQGDALLLVRLPDWFSLGVADFADSVWDVVLYLDRSFNDDLWINVTESIGKVDASEEMQAEVGRRIRYYLTTEQFKTDKETLRRRKEDDK